MIVKIPLELKQQWDSTSNKDSWLRDICNVRQGADNPFIKMKSVIFQMFDTKRPNPYNDRLPYTFDLNFKCENNTKPRFMHIDLGLNRDSAGISSCYMDHFISPISKMGSLTNFKPYIVFDFLAKITAPHAGEIIISDVETMIYNLTRRGFNIALITFDRFQSASTIQNLRSNGYTVDILSLDRTTHRVIVDSSKGPLEGYVRRDSTDGQHMIAWQTFKDVIVEGRISCPYYLSLKEELECAEFAKEKVEGVKGISLDLMESMAGSVFNLVNNTRYMGKDPAEEMIRSYSDPFYSQTEGKRKGSWNPEANERNGSGGFPTDEFYADMGIY